MKLFRMIKFGFRDAFRSVFRNFSLSLASISCITITLIVVAFSLLVSLNVKNFTRLIKEDVTTVVFVDHDVTEDGVREIEKEIQELGNIASIEYISKEDSKEEMQKEYPNIQFLLEDWPEEDNPLLDSFKVKVVDIEKIEDTANKIKAIEGVRSVDYGETVIETFLSSFDVIEKGALIIVIMLIFVTVFLIVNTIKLTIFSRKREISIMRLVGSGNFFIKMPFVVEGMVLGMLGSIIPILSVIYGYYAVYEHSGGRIFSGNNYITLIPPMPFAIWVSLAVLAIGVLVGMLGSYRAVRKYLKV